MARSRCALSFSVIGSRAAARRSLSLFVLLAVVSFALAGCRASRSRAPDASHETRRAAVQDAGSRLALVVDAGPSVVDVPDVGVALLAITPTEETLARAERLARGSVDVNDVVTIGRRIVALGELARAGAPRLVELPLVQRSDGWGCECPLTYVGADSISHGGGDTWLTVRMASDVELPRRSTHDGRVSLVQGVFTGEREDVDLRSMDGEPEEWLYRTHVFYLTRVVRASLPYEGSKRMRVLGSPPDPASFVCRSFVDDPDPPARVRQSASLRAPIVGELPTGTEVRFASMRAGFVRITEPLEGFVFGRLITQRCLGE